MGGGRAAAWCSRLAPAPGGRGTGGEFMNGECGAGEAGARGGAAHVTALAARPLRAPGAARSAARRPRCALGWVWLAPRRPPPPLPFRRGRGAEPALPGAHSARGAAPRTRRGGRAPPPAHRHDSPRPVLRSQGRSSGCPGIHDSAARGPFHCPYLTPAGSAAAWAGTKLQPPEYFTTGRCVVNVACALPGVVVRACALAGLRLPDVPARCPPRPPGRPRRPGVRCPPATRFLPPAAAMLPAALLRRPGLSRLVRHVRAYAEAAAAPAAASGPNQMSFTFASPTQVFFNGANVRQVDVPTLTGAFGILAAHVPTLQVLRPGLVVVHAEDGTTSKYFVSSGSIAVNADSSVQLLAEEAVTLDMLDLGAAKANLEKAQAELLGAADEATRAEIQIRIEANEALVKALE
nr:uncharacterized protein LOC129465708 isoform X2 [Symphalangus syndactylus]